MVADALRLLCEELLVSQGIVRGDEQLAGVETGAAAWTYVCVSSLGHWRIAVLSVRAVLRGAYRWG